MFQGTYEHTLDAKGRVSMPGDFRHALGPEQRLVIARNLDPGCQCLTAFPLPEWHAFVERLGAHADFDPNAIKLNRLVMSGAVECAIDKQGRVLIPPTLRAYAGLRRDVLWVGVGRKLEVWDQARFAEEDERLRQQAGEITRALAARQG
ncbi:MAG TPA: division/cell wall cluster transcriptional repressor MraZ [Polyangia bacterium]|jgi:MraZ protein